jgi:hypothetical protein
MLASPDDLADYRAFRTASRQGPRLARAQIYLERHPRGAWVDEVQSTFDAEEPAWFESAKTSRSRARTYLVELPRGPHADAARALLVLFDEHQGDVETLELLAEARRTSALLDEESAKRRRVGEIVLQELAALLDPPTWGARLDAPPPALADVLRGAVRRSWGGATRAWRADQLFFVVPTPAGVQSRLAELKFQLWVEGGRIARGVIQGSDLFARWVEAMQLRLLEPSRQTDRATAAQAVADVLGGAVEAQLPSARCTPKEPPADWTVIFARDCDGWSVVARTAERDGDDDTIEVRGPQPQP